MATIENADVITLEASGDLSANQFHFVSMDSNGRAALTGAGLAAAGVLLDKPSALGRAGKVQFDGVSKVVAGGTVTAGGPVASDANGEAVDATLGDIVLGTARTGTTTAGEVIEILLVGSHVSP